MYCLVFLMNHSVQVIRDATLSYERIKTQDDK